SAPIRVSWAQRFQVDGGAGGPLADFFSVEARTASGADPVNLFRFEDGVMRESGVGDPPTTVDDSAGWGTLTRSLDAFAGGDGRLAFHFASNTSSTLPGLAIDDVSVTACCTAQSCDDHDPCTDDRCDAALGCVHVPNTAACDDADPCTTGDTCSGGVCRGVNPCDDGDPCTVDTCQAGGGCAHAQAGCDDANPCP